MRTTIFSAIAAFTCVCAEAEDTGSGLPPIGIIDFHGLRSHTEAEVRKLLPFKEGDSVPVVPGYNDGSAIARALDVPDVRLSFVCCTPDQQMMVFIGVAESPPSALPPPPTGAARLPEKIIRDHEEFMSIFMELIESGKQAPSDHSQGHYLDPHPPLRALQEKFVAFARDDADLIHEVLASSSDSTHRAVAAMLAGYQPDKSVAAKVLSKATLDPDPSVRNNATRALAIIAEFALLHPDLEISIDAAPFIDMLNSSTWTDLNKGIWVINTLSASRDPALLAELRSKARPALVDICRWKSAGHAEPGCAVLRRVEGLPDRPGPEGRAEVLRLAQAR